ncbi:MAG TPA: N-glycosylase/DNA lyase [Desulfatiglandales bacterium]|nr:N-glycosylase/DNA lyase [Desulfatiglandales bacterium]
MGNFSSGKGNRREEIKSIYESKRQEIELRLNEFTKIWKKGTKKEIFAELVFCILTPQANGKLCWSAVENMIRKGVLFTGDRSQIVKELSSARFIHKKSAYIVEAREKFLLNSKVSLKSIISQIGDGYKAREWLVQNVKGIGYKEASHFLRNIGFEQNLAILDRHIVRNLQFVGVIKEIPGSLSKGRYFDIEKRMMEFSKAAQIPMSHLDLVMWYKETGEIFK